jgi:DNA-binding CsgD family transcriptional regulator
MADHARISSRKRDAAPTRLLPAGAATWRHSALPIQRGSLIGRVRELAEVRRLLLQDDVGLVTLTGPGGSGKTRLALAVATEVEDQFADDAYVVALAPISDPDLVTHAICEALGVRGARGRPLIERLVEHLRGRQLLLVLDNFEQVLSAEPRIVELLESCPALSVLVTSRAVLRVSGEHDVPVSPLSVRPPGCSERRRRCARRPAWRCPLSILAPIRWRSRRCARLGTELPSIWEAGRAAPLEQVVDEALTSVEPLLAGADAPSAASDRPAIDPAAGLSRRERGVIIRIARGHNNPRIGAELAVSRRTVAIHVSAIFNKLGLSSRTQNAAWAVQHGLTTPAADASNE